jgi:hypothetical protein
MASGTEIDDGKPGLRKTCLSPRRDKDSGVIGSAMPECRLHSAQGLLQVRNRRCVDDAGNPTH